MSIYVKDTGLNFVKFSRNGSKLLIGKKNGVKIFNVIREESIYEYNLTDVYLVELIGQTSTVGAVCCKKPMELKVLNIRNDKLISLCFTSSILSLASNKEMMVVCLEDSIEMIKIKDLKTVHSLPDMPTGYKGLCSLSQVMQDSTSYLAHPISDLEGLVQVFDVTKKKVAVTFNAHRSPIAVMNFHPTTPILATASTKGTVIRLTSVLNGQKLVELRRGFQRSATLFSLAFNEDGSLLCCSSNTGTVHVFKIDPKGDEFQQNSSKSSTDFSSSYSNRTTNKPAKDGISLWSNYLSGFIPPQIKQLYTAVPQYVTDTYLGSRSILKARLKSQGKNYSHFANIDDEQKLVVASDNGGLYVFDLEGSVGGECRMNGEPLSIDYL